MKGVVFTEFLEMVDDKFSPEVTERIIDNADLASNGAYTAVGTYDHTELVKLVVNLAAETGAEVPDLIRVFGEHFFGRLATLYPQFVDDEQDVFSFLESVENYIHIEVRKLYPDADLPSVKTERPGDGELILMYESKRCLADAAHGLILGCLDHFKVKDKVSIDRQDESEGKGSRVRFTLSKAA